jgi:hypothetical protein
MDKPKKVKSAFLLLGALLIAAAALFVFGWLAEEMLEGDTQQFDAGGYPLDSPGRNT